MQGFDYYVVANAIMWDPLKKTVAPWIEYILFLQFLCMLSITPMKKFLSNFVVLGSQFNYFD